METAAFMDLISIQILESVTLNPFFHSLSGEASELLISGELSFDGFRRHLLTDTVFGSTWFGAAYVGGGKKKWYLP